MNGENAGIKLFMVWSNPCPVPITKISLILRRRQRLSLERVMLWPTLFASGTKRLRDKGPGKILTVEPSLGMYPSAVKKHQVAYIGLYRRRQHSLSNRRMQWRLRIQSHMVALLPGAASLMRD